MYIENHRIRFTCCSIILATQVFNMLHNMVGVGTLAFPSTFDDTGLIPGIIITLLCAFMVFQSAELIILNMLRVRRWTFLGISKELYPPIISNIIELLKAITTFFSSTAFAITALDNLPCIFISSNFNGRILNAIILFILLIIPVILDDINSLDILSLIGLLVFIISVLVLNGYIIINNFENDNYEILTYPNSKWFPSISKNCLAFAIHYNATRYYYEIAREELKIILRERDNLTTNEEEVLTILENDKLSDIDYMNAMSTLDIEIHEQSKK